jgi:DNA topoisomerase I
MARKLVIVESPSKAKTIKKFLGPDFEVRASAGHIVDLPLKGLGINVRKRFAPRYEIIKGKESVLAELRAATRDVEEVYLAPDPDREGEAISWHLANVLDLPQPRRAIFNEITSTAVQQGIAAPRAIDPNLVNAQQARRILDRLVGYKISPILWRKVLGNTSAGRVQSVALRLICEREKEIRAFVPEEYWTVTARLSSRGRQRKAFEAKLVGRRQDGATTKLDPRSEAEAQELVGELRAATFVVGTVTHKTQRRQPPAPYTTSTLQQDASSRLRFSPKKTMTVAQELYEGVDLGERGMQGLITYMRTDSIRVAAEAATAAQELITSRFGKRYVRAGPQPTARRASHVQDAHEAIRPTDVMITPDVAKPHLTGDQVKLYTLVWQRFVASQMAPAVLATTSAEITAGALLLQASGTTLQFEGFYAVWPREGDKDVVLPGLTEGAALLLQDVEVVQHWTQGPQRYTEASLIKELEELGVGRPSTYVPTLVTIQKRKYVALEQRRFVPLWLGETVNELMTRHFSEIVDTKFTAAMERKLDEVEEGKQEWVDLLSHFYDEFKATLSEAEEKIGPVEKPVEETDQICPVCGSPMVIKLGRFGRFLSCSNYPTCTHSEQLLLRIGVPCPEPGCGGDVIERHTRRGRVFYGCSRYPTCRFASWDRPLAERCPECGGLQAALGGRHAGQVRCTACGRTVEAPRETPEAHALSEAETPDQPDVAREPVGVGA